MKSLEEACAGFKSLAIAGTAKNAGKTTTLNFLIDRFTAAGELIGLSSVGRDGEAIDQLTNRPKPRVRPPVGALVATAHDAAVYSQATLEKVASTTYRTALGPVSIYRVVRPGFVEVAGPVKVAEASALIGQLKELGCTKILLDGAADRRAFIGAGVDGFVLATGLVLSKDVDEVVTETRAVLSRLQLSAPSSAWRSLCQEKAGAIVGTEFVPWPGPSFLADLSIFQTWLPPQADALFVPGALANSLVQAVLDTRRRVDFVLPAGTHVLADRWLLDRLVAKGCQLYALNPLKAVALTLNPSNPDGETVEPQFLLNAFRSTFPDLAVFDVVWGSHLAHNQ